MNLLTALARFLIFPGCLYPPFRPHGWCCGSSARLSHCCNSASGLPSASHSSTS